MKKLNILEKNFLLIQETTNDECCTVAIMKKPFVDRIEELRHLNRALKYDGEESPVLVFTGIGGMGKTALRIAFEEQILKPNKVPYAVLDYDGDPNLRAIEATLRTIRRQLGRYGIRTPVFDYLYARYFELSTGVKLSASNYPLELEGVVNILEGIPIVGNVTQVLYGLSQLGLKVKERVRHKEWLYRIRDLEPREVLDLLPSVLAEDLEETMSSQTPEVRASSDCRLALLLDAYEHLSESHLDDTHHRTLLLLTPHLLRVIFTRDPLPWEHTFPGEWHDKVIHFPALDDLSLADARAFLREKNIEDTKLQEYLYRLTGGYPLHLELCADIYQEIEVATNRKAQIKDFEGVAQAKDLTEELVRRLLRQLKDDERDLMRLAVYPRWFSERILEVLSSVPESVPRIFKKFIGLSMISLHPEIPEAYVIRKEVRESLLSQQRKKPSWTRQHRKLAIFHRECWQDTDSFQYLREALYHGCYDNPEESVNFFEGKFYRLLEKQRFGEAEGLLEAIPADILSVNQKRKVDYARARLTACMAQSRKSLTTAKNLYETLVASEADECALRKYLFDLGHLMRLLADYKRSLDYLQRSLTIGTKILGEEHPDVARTYDEIGMVYRIRGEYEKALKYHHLSLDIALKTYGEKHRNIAICYNSIGLIHNWLCENEKALEYFQKSLEIWLTVVGEEHPDVATCYNNIGIVYKQWREYDKALEYHLRSLAIRMKVYGKEHPEVAMSYTNLGNVYKWKDEYEKALDYHQKVLAICLKVYGEEHPDVAGAYNNIGDVYLREGACEKALDFHQKGFTIERKIFGEDHPRLAASYCNIADILWGLKHKEAAFESMRKSGDMFRKFHLWQHAAQALQTLAGWLEETGKTKDAAKVREETNKIRKEHNVP